MKFGTVFYFTYSKLCIKYGYGRTKGRGKTTQNYISAPLYPICMKIGTICSKYGHGRTRGVASPILTKNTKYYISATISRLLT